MARRAANNLAQLLVGPHCAGHENLWSVKERKLHWTGEEEEGEGGEENVVRGDSYAATASVINCVAYISGPALTAWPANGLESHIQKVLGRVNSRLSRRGGK